MRTSFYKKHTEEFFKSHKLITKKDIKNYKGQVIPQGSVVSVTKKWRGFEIFLERDRIWISRVHPELIELI